MGLDMYLSKKVYVGANYCHNKVTGRITIKRDGVPIKVKLEKVTYILQEQAYWRNSNQIHKWFVENVQDGEDDCKPYDVSGTQLLELVDLCKQVLSDHSKAEKLLPTQSGFFFGNYEYDEDYFDDIKRTIEMLKDVSKNSEYEYQSNW